MMISSILNYAKVYKVRTFKFKASVIIILNMINIIIGGSAQYVLLLLILKYIFLIILALFKILDAEPLLVKEKSETGLSSSG